jgi:hypothetical protein
MKLPVFASFILAATGVSAHLNDAHFPFAPHHHHRRAVHNSAAGASTLVPRQNTTSNATSSANTTSAANTTALVSGTVNVQSTVLVIARDAYSASSASSGLNGYGIPFQVLLVPQTGVTLPALNSSSGGNFGGVIVASQVSYDYGGGNFSSALTADQWNQIYAYQTDYGVRMVQYDVYPGPLFGATALGGCCNSGVEQLISFTNTTGFAQAGIKTGAGVSTQGLYHYPATVSDATTTWQIAQFAAGGGFQASTAAVINNFAGRQQMAFFIGWATDWSATSNFLQHAYITWLTRGLYAGYRRINYNTQIDDMFLPTGLYLPNGTEYRVTPSDMTQVASWVPKIQAKMPAGSSYFPEIGHNGNGNVEAAVAVNEDDQTCSPFSIEYDEIPDTPLEFKKPLGSGINEWPLTPTTYKITAQCVRKDPLEVWFATAANRDKFMHISHTHTHLELNNATYADALKEIQFNQAWFKQTGIQNGKFSSGGLIPPAITGLHNGDVLRAWTTAGLTHCVGDNTRPVLRNQQNFMWPSTTSVANDGFDGFLVLPRWATRIYYNCDTPACTTQEWIDTSAGSGNFQNLLDAEKADTMRHLFGLYHDGYMFHQANLRTARLAAITINGVSSKISIFQAWVETNVQEFARLVNWPMITLKQDDLAKSFKARQGRDACNYGMSWTKTNNQITGVTVTANGNTCAEVIPITVPGTVTNTQGSTTEKIGSDPLTIWVKLSGATKSFTLTAPISV